MFTKEANTIIPADPSHIVCNTSYNRLKADKIADGICQEWWSNG